MFTQNGWFINSDFLKPWNAAVFSFKLFPILGLIEFRKPEIWHYKRTSSSALTVITEIIYQDDFFDQVFWTSVEDTGKRQKTRALR